MRLAPQFQHLRPVPHQHHIREIDKQPVLDDAGYFAKSVGQSGRIRDLFKVTVQDVMPFVGDERFSRCILSQLYRGAQS